MGEKARPQCYFDVEINREAVGRIVFQLFSDVCPKTCMNFLCLCTGQKGIGKVTGKKLWFKGSTFHRVVKNFIIQGGDFSEGNGKGGESIYGGFFKDENFILKHDRAFLLSMANRGKNTNGSQFFITTKAAPHLDGVHVVFGLVISGFEVIERIENQKTDAASRPYADVRVVDCGLVGSNPPKDVSEKVKPSKSEESDSSSKPSSSSSSSSESSFDSETEVEKNRRKRKRKAKVRHSKKKRKENPAEPAEEELASQQSAHCEKSNIPEDKESSTKRDKPVVRPEEIPPVPENRFLLRKDAPPTKQEGEMKPSPAPDQSEALKGSITKSGRKIRGRGTIRYHTPPRSRSHSESDDGGSSETPPHWKEEMQRLKAYKPPSGEKWSKGDKLNDRLSSRWDEGSLSSRSSSWSHDGYRSDDSRERASRSKTRRDKKVKHNKRGKKTKHTKKHKLSRRDPPVGSHREESTNKKRKSLERTRSSSRSSRASSKRGRTRSNRDHRSSGHSSNYSSVSSKSRSRSHSRGKEGSKTRSTSGSRSHSQSRSRSKSKSRKRNVSGAHSSANLHSSKQLRSSSPSSQKQDVPLPKNKPNPAAETEKTVAQKSANSAVDSLSTFVTTKSAPLISLSDSPPPSRWKPGQKPWKPSYERMQVIKPKTSNVLGAQTRHGGSATKNGSQRNRHASSDSEQSDYSRSSSHRHKKKHRSSRKRSHSRSYSRSSSSSRDMSSLYDSSSSSDSIEDTSRTEAASSKEKNKTKTKIQKHVVKSKPLSRKSTKSYSNSSSQSEGDEFTKNLLQSTKALLEVQNSHSSEDTGAAKKDAKISKSAKNGAQVPSEKDGTQAVLSDIDKVLKSEKLKQTVEQVIKEEKSESNSQNPETTEDRAASSGKEEGEASSESDSEAVGNSKTPSSEKLSHASESISEKLVSPTSETSTTKSKTKKRKRHSSKKKSHSKKSKEKPKKKKEKKQKSQNKKQTFHWQPPLEFGEEDEEETVVGNVDVQLSNAKELLPDKSSADPKITPNGSLLTDKEKTQPSKVLLQSSAIKTEKKDGETLPSLVKSPLTPAKVSLTSNDLKTFTSHRSLPQIRQEAASPLNGTTTAHAASVSEKSAAPSPAVIAVAESVPSKDVQVKEQQSSDTQPAVPNAPNLEKSKAVGPEALAMDNKWKPVQGPTVVQLAKPVAAPVTPLVEPEKKPQGLRIEIKSKNKVKPGSLFDEVRKTARLNQRPRKKEESSSEEGSSSHSGKSRSASKSRSVSSHRSRSRSSSHSRSRSHSYSSSSRSRSYTRSSSRRRYSRNRSRTRSRSYSSYRSRSRTYSRSRSRSPSYYRKRRRSRSRSHTYDSYYSRSRSRSRSATYRRSRSYDRRSRSRRSSYSGSDRSYSRRRR
ncbi:LOW QUALITY PROTEIN: NK-tumor recognition protein [Gastrophryne carolinensis]